MAMSSKGTRTRHRGPRVKGFGTYRINGTDDNARITITKDLDCEPFPNDIGVDLNVDLVIPEDGLPHIELHPVLDEDECEVAVEKLMTRWAANGDGHE